MKTHDTAPAHTKGAEEGVGGVSGGWGVEVIEASMIIEKATATT